MATKKDLYTRQKLKPRSAKKNEDLIRLNRYIANAGVCSRREADKLIVAGLVRVNNKVVTELGTKVRSSDKVTYKGNDLRPEQNVYILINKPKDYITTASDPQGRKTVIDLVKDACHQRVFPVGRLDRATTGVLLLTNDGALTKKLTHPSHQVKKVYKVTTDKIVDSLHLKLLALGIELEDGVAVVDSVAFAGAGNDKTTLLLQLHSGKNRVIRRMFEAIGYKIKHLDRIVFANLTKKNLPRGKWRFLSNKEVGILMRMNHSRKQHLQ